MGDYYLQTWYIRVASRVAERLKTEDLRKFRNIRKVSKLHRMIAYCSVPRQNKNFVSTSRKSRKIAIKLFPRCAISHKTRVSLKYPATDCRFNSETFPESCQTC